MQRGVYHINKKHDGDQQPHAEHHGRDQQLAVDIHSGDQQDDVYL